MSSSKKPLPYSTLIEEKPYYPFIRMKYKKQWQRFLHYYKIRLLRLQGHPRSIARGLAFGTFAGFFPLFGLQMIIAVLLATLFRGNKFAAMAATWISNPFTYVPIFLFNFQVGRLLLNLHIDSYHQETIEFNWNSWQSLSNEGLEVTITLFYGCFVIGLIAGIGIYFISLSWLKRWRRTS